MSRSHRRLRATAVVGLVAAAAIGGSAAAAQEPARAGTATAPVLDLVLPVLDLELTTASLDASVRRADSAKAIRVTLATDVLFAFDRARLSGRSRSRIAEAVAEIRRLKPATLTVEGHTDSKGSPAYNRALSQRRAEAVRRALVAALGSRAPRIVAEGRGETEPVASNTRDGKDNPRGRALNRRVEVRIPKR